MDTTNTPNIETPMTIAPADSLDAAASLESAVIAAKPRLLAVDDEEQLRVIYQRCLGDIYDVVTASDGDEALDIIALTHHDPKLSFPVILLDVIMQRVHGDQVYRTLRSEYSPKGYNPFVLFMTGYDFGKINDIMQTSGLLDKVMKPLNIADMRSCVDYAFQEHESWQIQVDSIARQREKDLPYLDK